MNDVDINPVIMLWFSTQFEKLIHGENQVFTGPLNIHNTFITSIDAMFQQQSNI